MNPWIIISLIGFLVASLYRREWGIYLIVLGLPSYQIRFQVFGVPATFLEGMILLLAAVEVIALIRNPRILSILSPLPACQSPEGSRPMAGRPNPLPQGEGIKTRDSSPLVGGASSERRRGEEVRWGVAQYIFIILFLLAAVISVFIAPDTLKAAGIFKAYFFEPILFYFLLRLTIDSQEKLKKLFQSMTVLVLYLSAFGVYQYLTLQNLPPSWWDVSFAERRIVSLLNHPNGLALLLGPVLTMLIMLPKNKLRWTALGFGLVAFYLTFSRAGWLALAATLVGVAFLIPSPGEGRVAEGQERSRTPKLLLSLLVIITLVFAIPVSRAKLLNLTHADPSKENRYVLWTAAVDILKHHPITGVGLTGFREAYKNYPLGPDRVIQNYPHNFFLTFWVETGLLGLLSIIGLLILFYKKIYKTVTSPSPPHEEGQKQISPPREGEIKRGLALAAGAGMAMIVLHSLVDVSYFKNDLSILFWLVYVLPFLDFQFD